MSKLSLSLLTAFTLFAVACKGDDKGTPAKTETPKTAAPAPAAAPKADAPKTEAPAPTAAPAPAAGKGVYSILPECETALTKVTPCYEKLPPENFGRQAYDSIKTSARSVETLTPETKQFTDAIAQQCTTFMESTVSQKDQICPGVQF